MKSFTTLRDLYGTLTIDTSSDNKTLGDQLINDAIREIMSQPYDWDFLEKTATDTTVASQQAYELPADYDKLDNVKITVGSTEWSPREVTDRKFWDRLTQTTFKSDIPEYYFIFAGQMKFSPTPSSSSNVITYEYKKSAPDLNIADYSTGNIDIITNGSASVTGAGSPAWTTPMAGRFLRVTHSNTAASSGDHKWYEIKTIDSSTTLTLVREYQGTSLTTGAAASYVLGQMPTLPEAYHNLPVYKAVEIFWSTKDEKREKLFREKYNDGLERLVADHGSKSNDVGIPMNRIRIENPNHLLTL